MLYLVSFQPAVEHASANQNLAPHTHGRQRIDGPVRPLSKRSLRHTSVCSERLQIQPFGL